MEKPPPLISMVLLLAYLWSFSSVWGRCVSLCLSLWYDQHEILTIVSAEGSDRPSDSACPGFLPCRSSLHRFRIDRLFFSLHLLSWSHRASCKIHLPARLNCLSGGETWAPHFSSCSEGQGSMPPPTLFPPLLFFFLEGVDQFQYSYYTSLPFRPITALSHTPMHVCSHASVVLDHCYYSWSPVFSHVLLKVICKLQIELSWPWSYMYFLILILIIGWLIGIFLML